MTHPIYTRDLLKNFSRSELHKICDAKGIARRRSKEDCIADILANQPQLQAVAAVCQVEEVDLQIQDYIEQLNGLSYGYEDGAGDIINFADGHPYYADGDLWLSEKPEAKIYITWEIGKTVEQLAAEIKELVVSPKNDEQQDDYLFHDEQQPTNLPKVGDTHFIGDFSLQCAAIGGDYATVWDVRKDGSLLGEIRMDWNCFWCHTMSFSTFATPQEAVIDLHESLLALVEEQRTQPDKAIAFDKVADGRWQSIVNGVFVRIISVQNGYTTNLTGDVVLADYDTAIIESLLAVARLQVQPEIAESAVFSQGETPRAMGFAQEEQLVHSPALEVFATTRPNIFAVYSHKARLESKRYEVDLTSESCTCPHYEHRHSLEGFKDKHIEAVKTAVAASAPLLIDPQIEEDRKNLILYSYEKNSFVAYDAGVEVRQATIKTLLDQQFYLMDNDDVVGEFQIICQVA
ncbi:MAG: hypothetical protein V7L22_23360 [Nostoc sp.]|uniref:hypothetical protein n=1 Tax=Nostoc sp. TaxID=1180 RepID=UPI002FF7FBC6